jgi:cobyrinic acid a,c-diamide synthase
MAGVFALSASMEKRLSSLGYREVVTQRQSVLGPVGTHVRGHEFHYSRIAEDRSPAQEGIYQVSSRRGSGEETEGYWKQRTLGSYIHLHWGSNPDAAANLVDACRTWTKK